MTKENIVNRLTKICLEAIYTKEGNSLITVKIDKEFIYDSVKDLVYDIREEAKQCGK